MNTLTIRPDTSARFVLTGYQDDHLTPLTVTLPDIGADMYRLEFQRPDGKKIHLDTLPVSETNLLLPDVLFAREGQLWVQAVMLFPGGRRWHSASTSALIGESIKAVTPATPDDRRWVEVPVEFVEGNITSYSPASGRLIDTGRSVDEMLGVLDFNAAFDAIDTTVSSHLAEGATQAHLPKNVGLGNVDNTSDLDKPISTATQTALDGKVNNSQVLTNVPVGAKFTDTVYTHPASHPASMITESSTKRFVSDSEKSTWNSKSDTDTVTTINGKTGAIAKEDIVALGIPAQDTDTTYTEITTAEIDAGTASTLRTITARRLKYLLDKIVALFPTKVSQLTNDSGFLTSVTKSDVGLSNVTNDKQMPISGGVLENYREKLVTLSGTSTAINLSLGNVFAHTLSGNTTYSITNAVSGQAHSFTLIINMGSTVRTLTFPASVKWQGGEIPDLSTASKTYVLTFMTIDGGTNWFGMFGGEF